MDVPVQAISVNTEMMAHRSIDRDQTDRFLSLWRDTRSVRALGGSAIEPRQRSRLAEIVAHARAHSPFYREFLRDVPDNVMTSSQLPVTNKRLLMSRFDDWATDREITLNRARAFVENPATLGERFLGRHLAVTTSGTTGTPGIFITDDRTLRVTNALALRMLGDWLSGRDAWRIVTGGARVAMLMATGAHHASAVAAARLQKRLGKKLLVLSVHMPVSELVAQLNRFQPALMAPYASLASQLAAEQGAGRLQIRPALMTLSAEGLPVNEYDRIASIFGAKVGNSYAASECMFMSYDCSERWLHVNADWVIVEPVKADYTATRLGERSHTVLITNLANRTQPIIRYDLGDSVLQRPDPCPCGNPLPAIRATGRTADVLTFTSARGDHVRVPHLAFGSDVSGVEQFQIVQVTPGALRVRLLLEPVANRDKVWNSVIDEIDRVLRSHGVSDVRIERADEPPEQGAGGKFREIIPLDDGSRRT